jgi:hypothetical protein
MRADAIMARRLLGEPAPALAPFSMERFAQG